MNKICSRRYDCGVKKSSFSYYKIWVERIFDHFGLNFNSNWLAEMYMPIYSNWHVPLYSNKKSFYICKKVAFFYI